MMRLDGRPVSRTPSAQILPAPRPGVLWAAVLLWCVAGCTPGPRETTEPPAAPARPQARIVSSLVRTGSANAQTSHIVRGIRLALSQAHWRAGDVELSYWTAAIGVVFRF